MTKPEGSLTSTQYEIMELIWGHGARGATVAEIWQVIGSRRSVGRTTILNLVDRLEKRGWLIRRGSKKPARYVAGLDREKTAALLAGRFADDFFGGSASELVMSLLGSGKFTTDEVRRLRGLLKAPHPDQARKEGGQP